MERIVKIYMGRDRICRCGCAGEYVEPGHPMFEKRVKRFQQMWANYTPKDIDVEDGVYKNVSYGKDRALTVYFG